MAAAKKSSGKIPSYSEESPKEQFRYIAALLEHVESEVKTIAEGQTYLTDKINQLDTKVESVRSELKEEIQLTQTALIQRMDDVEARLEKKIDDVKKGHDERFDRLETKMDKIVEKVDEHDTEIGRLKSAVFPA